MMRGSACLVRHNADRETLQPDPLASDGVSRAQTLAHPAPLTWRAPCEVRSFSRCGDGRPHGGVRFDNLRRVA